MPSTIPVAFLKKSSLLLLLPLLMGCEDSLDKLYPKAQPVQLPAETTTGANVLGCRLNGDVWEANNTATLTGKVLTPTAHYRNGELRIDAFRRLQVTGPVTNIHFTVAGATRPGVYQLRAAEQKSGSFATLETASGRLQYATNARQTGKLTITRLDTTGAHPVVSGRFELRAAPTQPAVHTTDLPAHVQLTEGRFDIQLSR
ncbi:DUF6252 family protein [Hymenobacter glacialis]|uniref:Uncharacterized protein n=1 Tax=Hymenobacter glacialis TaxID=1908236 RepID=A0A1G1SSZ9_9BACT|nr:DUF6252 family protein [Hymenobacter glacialis]OGX81748.1 hypothetical protein BEN48_05825 [Hymenobacter glacialis]